MKKNLGSIFFLIILLYTTLDAKQFVQYTLTANKKSGFIYEPIKVSFKVEQIDEKNVMFFFVKPKKTSQYDIQLLTSKTQEHGAHHALGEFTFIVFPLKAGRIKIDFDFSVKTASDKGVAHSYVEDHDDSKGIEFDVTKMPLKALDYEVLPLQRHVDLIGDFTLTSSLDTNTIDQFTNVNLSYKLQGYGYKATIKPITNIKDVTLFADTYEDAKKLTAQGYKINKEYLYSLSASHNFSISKKSIQVFSPKEQKYYTLIAPQYNIKVEKIDVSKLLDKEEKPETLAFIKMQSIQTLGIYVLIYLLGYSTSQLITLSKEKRKDTKEDKYNDIKESKNEIDLILVLLNNYTHQNINTFVTELESLKYKKSNKTFLIIKSEILRYVKNST